MCFNSLKLNKAIIICNYPKYWVVECMANQQTGGQNSITKYVLCSDSNLAKTCIIILMSQATGHTMLQILSKKTPT